MLLKLNIQLFASKKGVGSTKNGRDSEAKRLGAKASDGEVVTAGSILYRQTVQFLEHRTTLCIPACLLHVCERTSKDRFRHGKLTCRIRCSLLS